MTTTSADKAEQLLNQLHAGIETLTTSDAWTTWLDVARTFHSYSVNNTILIWTQRPDATHVAGYHAWRKLGRQVRKGERGIRILAPMAGKATDDDTGEERRIIRGFRSVAVFDIAQTDGDPLPDAPVTPLVGDAPHLFRQRLACLIRAEGFRFSIGDMPPGHAQANGVTDWGTRTVTIRADLTDAQAAKTTAHELGHVLMHNPDSAGRPSRDVCEIEAESVAYLLCGNEGLDSAEYSLGYVAGWASGDHEAIAATAGRVLDTARAVIDRLTAAAAAEAA